MNWSSTTWQASESIYKQIIDMPFIKELQAGTLPFEKFKYYILQDTLYLQHYARVLSMIAAKVGDVEDLLTFVNFAAETVYVENMMHSQYADKFQITELPPIAPTCHHYTSFLKSTVAFESVEVAMAAVLPCFWIYKEVGDYILSQPQVENNPYQDWIDTYAAPEFAISVEKAIAICDKVAAEASAATRNKMTEAYLYGAKLEFQFWDAGYTLQKWEL